MDFDFMVDALLRSVSHIGFGFKHYMGLLGGNVLQNDMKT